MCTGWRDDYGLYVYIIYAGAISRAIIFRYDAAGRARLPSARLSNFGRAGVGGRRRAAKKGLARDAVMIVLPAAQ